MSFSSEVKEELSRHLGKSRHCQIAELAALIADKGPQAALAQISGLDAASDVVAEAVNDYNAEK